MQHQHKLLFILLSFFFLSACSVQPKVDEFSAVDGQLDLTAWNVKEETIPLNGQWEFYWKQLLDPADFNQPMDQSQSIQLPGVWSTHSINGEPLPKVGYATYRLHVSIDKIDEVLSLRIPAIHSNYTIWIDDKLLTKTGKVSINEIESVPQKYPKVIDFLPKNHTFTVTLQVSNFHYVTGGLPEPITFGTSENIHNQYFKRSVLQAFMLGILVLAGVYHIGLGIYRRTESYFFYFGAFCLLVALRSLMIGDVFFTKMFPHFNWELAMKLDYIILYSHVPLIAMVLYRLYREEMSRFITRICTIIPVIFDVFTIFTTAKIYPLFTMYFQFFMLICVVYAGFIIVKIVKRKQKETYYLLTGFGVLMVTSIGEIFGNLLGLPETNLLVIGISVFVVCFSLVISRRLSYSLKLSEKLAWDLTQLNNELETKVEQRTQQIKQSHKQLEELNNKLKEMALVDGLTNIPNRRSFDEYFDVHFQKCQFENKPISVLLVDIDYFKKYNDYYGHQMGDQCLKLVAQTLNENQEGLVARYGGEEFVCVLPYQNQAAAKEIAQRLNRKIEQLEIPHEKSPISKHVTISIGLATMIPDQTTNKKELLKQADQALYHAKEIGRNQAVSFTP
ncbi:sensor domain-containing diguanylate cyclase [Litchfieldia salsa]|uniref:Diguanylate cyclase (GGDEF) domain-containing protein n=1 Tax=Litchfieldia salsa TaxID=930152 RepID=A0A1H0W2Y1_9BACI|nr:diguanylate cyclase [Litchfieldia salsa]SDP85100.1 diguanylate cyclase (GGDEF) domain-containing protein [Litchfieldia salsa]